MDKPARTEAQIEASRRNGEKSRGPVTEEGKNRSRMNAVKHGIYLCAELLVPGESPEAYETIRQAIFDEFQPATPYESLLIESVVNCIWKLHRVDLSNRDLLMSHKPEPLGWTYMEHSKTLNLLDRHQRHLIKIKENDLKQFMALKKVREENERNEPKNESILEPLNDIGITCQLAPRPQMIMERQTEPEQIEQIIDWGSEIGITEVESYKDLMQLAAHVQAKLQNEPKPTKQTQPITPTAA